MARGVRRILALAAWLPVLLAAPSRAALTVERRLNTLTTGEQRLPIVASSLFGEFVVVWSGQQFGNYSQVFARRFSSKGFGLPLGSEFRVNTVTTSFSYATPEPRASQNAAGVFIVVWEDRTTTIGSVHGRLFLPTGDPFGGEFRVNSYTSSAAYGPEVAFAAGAGFVVAWTAAQPSDSSGIFLQRFNGNGVPLGAELRVNTITSGFQQVLSVSADVAGAFVVVWTDSLTSQIHGQRFASSLLPAGAEFRVSTASAASNALPSVAHHVASGGFVVAWEGALSGSKHVLLRRFDASGAALGAEVQVSTQTVATARSKVASLLNGEFVVMWSGLGTSYDILARRIAVTGTPLGAPFRVNTYTSANQLPGGAALGGGNAFAIVWESDGQDGSGHGIYGVLGAPESEFDTGELRVNTYTTLGQQTGRIAMDPSGSFTLVFASTQDGSSFGVYAKCFDEVGAPTSSEARINTNTTGFQGNPDVALLSDGAFVVVWQDHLDSEDTSNSIVGRRFLGTWQHPLGLEFRVNTITPGGQTVPRVAGSSSRFAVVWQDTQGSVSSVKAQLFSTSGAPLGGEFNVHQFAAGNEFGGTVGMDVAGNFVVAWTSSGQVLSRRFLATGEPIGADLRVNALTTNTVFDLALDVDQSGAFVVAWSQVAGAARDVFARRFDAQGQPIAAEFRVNTYTTEHQNYTVVGRRSDGQFVVAWAPDATAIVPRDVSVQRFGRSGLPMQGEFLASTTKAGAQMPTDAAFDAQGRFVVVFNSADGSGYAVNIRRFPAALSGDADGSGVVTVSDVLYLINFLFAGGPLPLGEADVNGDRAVNVSDVLYLINFLFAGGPGPV